VSSRAAPADPAPDIEGFLFILMLMSGYVCALALSRLAEPLVGSWPRYSLPGLLLLLVSACWVKRRSCDVILIHAPGRSKTFFGILGLMIGILLWSPAYGSPPTAHGTGIPLFGALSVILLSPISEELFFRGVCMNYFLRSSIPPMLTVLITTVLFLLLHLPKDPGTAMSLCACSLLFCAVALLSRSILWATAFHIGWNCLAMTLPEPSQERRWLMVGAACSALVLIGLYAYWSTGQERPSTA